MQKHVMAAVSAAGLFVAVGLAPVPAAAAPVPLGIGQSVLDEPGAVEKAWWSVGRCWRRGWHGPGWYRCRVWRRW
jgi:hypothetical protein